MDFHGFKIQWPNRHWTEYSPYLIFIIFVAIYNYLYLHQGYCSKMDEGYLQSMAMRILQGEIPYVDFYFFRTPLSLYLQAIPIWLFGDHYGIYSARIYYVIQTTLMVIIASSLYRQYLNKLELVIFLVASYTISTLMLNFPWYSYDSIFFAVIAVVLIDNKKFLWAGIAAFLAGMAKQNYFLLLPLIGIVFWFFRHHLPTRYTIGKQDIVRLVAGFIGPMLIWLIYMTVQGGVIYFFQNCVTMPAEIGGAGWNFTLFQDIDIALQNSSAIILAIILLHFGLKKYRILVILSVVILAKFGPILLESHRNFVYLILCINYLILIASFLSDNSLLKNEKLASLPMVPFISLIIIQYLSGFNYGGVIFAHIGAGLAFPLGYIIYRNISNSRIQKYMLVVLLILTTGVALMHKYNFIYMERPREELNTKFTTPKLSKIESTYGNKMLTDSLVSLIGNYSNENDYIFIFPDYSALYFLADRYNPTRIGWYYHREYNQTLFKESISELRRNHPEMILTHADPVPDLLKEFIDEYYKPLMSFKGMDIYIPIQRE